MDEHSIDIERQLICRIMTAISVTVGPMARILCVIKDLTMGTVKYIAGS